jgi:hypothetical protein
MPVTHVNRKEESYYLHVGTTRTGKPRYWFSRKTDGDLAEALPGGYEVYENPDAQVFLRKFVPPLVTPAEVDVVRKGLERYAPGQHCIVDVQKEHIVIYHAERMSFDLGGFGFGHRELPARFLSYTKVMRFTLVDEEARRFGVQRWCFRGSIDRWIDLWMPGSEAKLSDLVKKFCPHLGKESFFELM